MKLDLLLTLMLGKTRKILVPVVVPVQLDLAAQDGVGFFLAELESPLSAGRNRAFEVDDSSSAIPLPHSPPAITPRPGELEIVPPPVQSFSTPGGDSTLQLQGAGREVELDEEFRPSKEDLRLNQEERGVVVLVVGGDERLPEGRVGEDPLVHQKLPLLVKGGRGGRRRGKFYLHGRRRGKCCLHGWRRRRCLSHAAVAAASHGERQNGRRRQGTLQGPGHMLGFFPLRTVRQRVFLLFRRWR